MSLTRAHYVPTLLTKRGELGAVKDVPEDVKGKFTPLFVAHPVEWNYETDAPARSVAKHVAGLGAKLAGAFGSRKAYFDPVFLLEDAESQNTAPHPLLTVTRDAEENGLQLVPVVAPGRHPSCTVVAAQVQRERSLGFCIRLSPEHWPANPSAAVTLKNLLIELSAEPSEIDLVLDAAEHINSQVIAGLVPATLENLPYSADWRSLTLSAAPFPKDLSGLPRNKLSRIPRLDWQLWEGVVAQAQSRGWREPDFGDYGVIHPDPVVGVDPRMLSISASLRYTASAEWLVAKGGLFKGRGGVGGDAAIPVVRMIAESPEYCGPAYSAGDLWISEVANGASGGSGPEKWRRVATNHHLVFVTNSLATSGGTLASI